MSEENKRIVLDFIDSHKLIEWLKENKEKYPTYTWSDVQSKVRRELGIEATVSAIQTRALKFGWTKRRTNAKKSIKVQSAQTIEDLKTITNCMIEIMKGLGCQVPEELYKIKER